MDQTTLGHLSSGTPPVSPTAVLGGLVFLLSLCHVVAPVLVDELLALVPHHTVFTPVPAIPIPFIWNVGTAHFFEATLTKAAVTTPLVIVLTRLLERLWTAKAVAAHVIFTVTCSGALFFLTELIHVYRTHHEKDFFIPVSGCSGLIVALAVGVRHAYPLEPLPGLPRGWGLKYQHLAFAFTAVISSIGLLMPKLLPEWFFAPFALFFGWFHLRYLMWYPLAQVHGDHSEEFHFAALFPPPLRPVITCIGVVTHNLSAMVAPSFIQLRSQVDAEKGQAQPIVYDPTTAAFGNPNVSWTSGQGVATDVPGSKEYNARRAKALALLDQNISSLLAPENSTRPVPLSEGVELTVGGSGHAEVQRVAGVHPEAPSPLRTRGPPDNNSPQQRGPSPFEKSSTPPLSAKGGTPVRDTAE